MMGLFFAFVATGNYLAGTTEAFIKDYNIPLYGFLLALSIGSGVVLLLLAKPLYRMMRAGREVAPSQPEA